MRADTPLTAIIVMTLAAATGAAASDGRAADHHAACLESADTTADIRECNGAEMKRVDTAMTAAWQRALTAAGGAKSARGRLLLAEQRAWNAHKEGVCLPLYDQAAHGTIGAAILGPVCFIDMTEARRKYLARLPAIYKPN